MLKFSDYTDKISKAVHYHVENRIPLAENIYRLHSEEFYKLFREARELYNDGILEVTSDWDKHLLETDIGEFDLILTSPPYFEPKAARSFTSAPRYSISNLGSIPLFIWPCILRKTF